jgi:hypothetical protein
MSSSMSNEKSYRLLKSYESFESLTNFSRMFYFIRESYSKDYYMIVLLKLPIL